MQMAPPQNELVNKMPSDDVRDQQKESGEDCPHSDPLHLFTQAILRQGLLREQAEDFLRPGEDQQPADQDVQD